MPAPAMVQAASPSPKDEDDPTTATPAAASPSPTAGGTLRRTARLVTAHASGAALSTIAARPTLVP